MSIYNSDDLTFASSIAYYALLSLFPFFLLAFSILASVTEHRSGSRGGARTSCCATFPSSSSSSTSSSTPCSRRGLRLGVAGSVLMIWAAMGVFGAITSAVNHAWGVEKQPSYFKHKLISFVMLRRAGVLLVVGCCSSARSTSSRRAGSRSSLSACRSSQ